MEHAKEVAEALGIKKGRLRYYKNHGVFSPEISVDEGMAIEYTENDKRQLKTLVILNKAGLSCGEIKKIQDGKMTLQDALEQKRKEMDVKIQQMQGSQKLIEFIQNMDSEYGTLQTNACWNFIQQKEEDGEVFMDPDYSVFLQIITCPYCGSEEEVDLEEYSTDDYWTERENGMGPDIMHYFDSGEIHRCIICNRVFKIHGWIEEYPVGAWDSDNIEIEDIEDLDEGEEW